MIWSGVKTAGSPRRFCRTELPVSHFQNLSGHPLQTSARSGALRGNGGAKWQHYYNEAQPVVKYSG